MIEFFDDPNINVLSILDGWEEEEEGGQTAQLQLIQTNDKQQQQTGRNNTNKQTKT